MYLYIYRLGYIIYIYVYTHHTYTISLWRNLFSSIYLRICKGLSVQSFRYHFLFFARIRSDLPVSMPLCCAQSATVVTLLAPSVLLLHRLNEAFVSNPITLYRHLTPENIAVAVPAESGTCLSVLYVYKEQLE